MKKCETTKLFYNIYPYKVVLTNALATIFREKNLAHAKEELDALQRCFDQNLPLVRKRWRKEEHLSYKTFFDAKNLYIEFSKNLDFKLRVDYNTMQIYSHEYAWLKLIAEKFKANEFWEPIVDLNKLEKNVIVVKEKPAYEYKITLDTNVDPNLADWIDNNPGKAKAGAKCLDCIRNNGYTRGFYFYVRDDKILQLLNLFTGKLQRIDKLVYIAKTDK